MVAKKHYPYASDYFHDPTYLHQCAVGFSSVIFALKVVVNSYESGVLGFFDPTVWFEVVLIQILVPNASLIGHVAGVVAGFTYIWNAWAVRMAFKPVSLAFSFPATSTLVAALTTSYFDYLRKPWKTRHFWSSSSVLVCLSPVGFLDGGGAGFDPKRFLSSPVEHASGVHLAICLVSLVIKGFQLERRRNFKRAGPFIGFLSLVVFSALGTGFIYVVAARVVQEFDAEEFLPSSECALGFSGALFALKVRIINVR